MWLRFSGMALDKSQCFREHLFAIVVLHNHVIRTVERHQVFLSRTNAPVNISPVASRHDMIVNGSHNRSWGGDTRQLLAQLRQKLQQALNRSHRRPAIGIALVTLARFSISHVLAQRWQERRNMFTDLDRRFEPGMHMRRRTYTDDSRHFFMRRHAQAERADQGMADEEAAIPALLARAHLIIPSLSPVSPASTQHLFHLSAVSRQEHVDNNHSSRQKKWRESSVYVRLRICIPGSKRRSRSVN